MRTESKGQCFHIILNEQVRCCYLILRFYESWGMQRKVLRHEASQPNGHTLANSQVPFPIVAPATDTIERTGACSLPLQISRPCVDCTSTLCASVSSDSLVRTLSHGYSLGVQTHTTRSTSLWEELPTKCIIQHNCIRRVFLYFHLNSLLVVLLLLWKVTWWMP